MTNTTAKRDNSKKIRDFGVIANHRYFHRNNSNRFDQQIVDPVDNTNLLQALSLIAYSIPGRETPLIQTAIGVLNRISLFS
jgi:hypothetical protein